MNKLMRFTYEVAQKNGLEVDAQTGVLFGACNGYAITMSPVNQTTRLVLSVSVCQNAGLPDAKELKAATKEIRALTGCTIQGYKVHYTIAAGMSQQKTLENIQAVLEQLPAFLRGHGFANCCQSCGREEATAAYNISGAATLLCETCFANASAATDQKQQAANEKKENIIGGVVGALLGSVLGAAVIVLLGQLGYVAALSGVVMAVCTLKGYELLGGRLSNKGIVIGCVLILAMVYVGNQADWAIAVAQYFSVDVFTAFRAVPGLIAEESIEAGTYYTNLVMVYLFALVGAVPTILNTVRSRKQSGVTCKMHASEAELIG